MSTGPACLHTGNGPNFFWGIDIGWVAEHFPFVLPTTGGTIRRCAVSDDRRLDDLRLGQAGYEAYAKQTGGKTFDGRDMPTWEQLPDRIKEAWSAAAQGIVAAHRVAHYGLTPEPAPPSEHMTWSYRALAAFDADWHAHSGEHDRSPESGIVHIFRDGCGTDFGLPPLYGVPPTGAPPDWCGFTVAAEYIRSGMDEQLRSAFYHAKNVECHYTYGAQNNVNSKRFMAEVEVDGKWIKVRDWHVSQHALRSWVGWTELQSGDVKAMDFLPGDTLEWDWQGTGKTAEHIGMVRAWDGRFLDTFEGNRTGKGPNGEAWKESVVTVRYDLSIASVRKQIYGRGRPSPLDFQPMKYRAAA